MDVLRASGKIVQWLGIVRSIIRSTELSNNMLSPQSYHAVCYRNVRGRQSKLSEQTVRPSYQSKLQGVRASCQSKLLDLAIRASCKVSEQAV